MLRGYIFYKFLKTAFAVSFVLSLILFSLQWTRLGGVLLGVPLKDALGFFLVWSVYYTYFFLPDGALIASASLLFHFKEKRLLHVFYSFRISNAKLLSFFSIPFLSLWVLLLLFSQTLLEEKVAFVRKNLIHKFQDTFFSQIPPRSFVRLGDLVLYADQRRGESLLGVFFHLGDMTVLAGELTYRGGGVFEFKDGSLITRDDKLFLIRFERYTLSLRQVEKKHLREKRVRESKAVNLANVALSPLLFLSSFWLCLRYCARPTHLYILSASLLVLHQLFIFSVKLLL